MPPSSPRPDGTWPRWSTPTPSTAGSKPHLEREERAAHLNRYLSISPDRAGGVRLRGRGSAEDGALLIAALLPLTCPDPATRPGDRARSTATRATTAPGSGTPWSPPPNTPWTPTCRRRPTAPPPASWSPSTTTPSRTTSSRLSRGRDHRRRHRPTPRRPPPPGVRRRDHPRRPRHPGRGPRRRTTPPPGHRHHLDRAGPSRPTLHLPRLPTTTADVSRPPPHPLDQRRPNETRQPRPVMWPPPPRHPPHPLGNTTQPDRPKTRVQTTTHTRHRIRMDPISPQARIVAKPDAILCVQGVRVLMCAMPSRP